MRTKIEKVFPRSCFACGQPMRQIPATTTLWCRECDISEAGTVSGRWPSERRDSVEFGDEVIRFVDHGGKLSFPSPDSEGYQRGSVHVA
jgi:hypothetical protein